MITASTVPMVGPMTAPGPPPGAVAESATARNAAAAASSHQVFSSTHASMTSGNSSHTNSPDICTSPTHSAATAASQA